MVVGYSENVATCRGLGNFSKLLKRWKGSIYKVVWAELIVYLVCYYSLNCFYRLYLNTNCDQAKLAKKKFFIDVIRYCDQYAKNIPVSFILSFYVGLIVDRWWRQWMFLPWPDTTAITVACLVDGNDERGRLIRRTIMRYVNVSFVMSITLISTLGKLRFPSLTHFVAAGFLNEHEKRILDEMEEKTSHPKYWVPIVWAGTVARRARKEGKIRDDISLNTLITVLNGFRKYTQEMLNYDWVNVPLVYTQAVTLVVFTYFLASLIGKQLSVLTHDEDPVDFYFPFFTFFEFFFFFGWLKVAEVLINPFGIDDDDFEINWLIDRDFEISYVIVDEMHQEHPNLLKDHYWDEIYPLELPYTEATMKYKIVEGQGGSTKDLEVPEEKAVFIKESETSPMQKSPNKHTPGSSKNSLVDAIRTINSATRNRIVSRRGVYGDFASDRRASSAIHSGSRKSSTSSGKRAGSRTSLDDVGSNTSTTDGAVRKQHQKNRKAQKVGGYWGETSGHNILNVEELMEKDDIPYDPSKDSDKDDDEAEKEDDGKDKRLS